MFKSEWELSLPRAQLERKQLQRFPSVVSGLGSGLPFHQQPFAGTNRQTLVARDSNCTREIKHKQGLLFCNGCEKQEL